MQKKIFFSIIDFFTFKRLKGLISTIIKSAKVVKNPLLKKVNQCQIRLLSSVISNSLIIETSENSLASTQQQNEFLIDDNFHKRIDIFVDSNGMFFYSS